MSEPIFLGCTTPAQDARLLETIERAKDPATGLDAVRARVEAVKAEYRAAAAAKERAAAEAAREREERDRQEFEAAVFEALTAADARWLMAFRRDTVDAGRSYGTQLRAVRFDLIPIKHLPVRLLLAQHSCGYSPAAAQTRGEVDTWAVELPTGEVVGCDSLAQALCLTDEPA
jgi:hypothetical protein